MAAFSDSEDDYGMFRSARLIYRAPEPSDETGIFKKLTFERTGYALSNYTNNRLAGTKDAVEYRKFCSEKCLIAAVICLPALSSTPNDSVSAPSPSTASIQTPNELIPIGEVHLRGFNEGCAHHRSSELGMQILQAYQQKGYGTEAIQWLLHWAFHHTGLHRVCLKTLETNVGAIKCYVKCGFREEGRERESWWHDGRWQDIVCMSLLDREWRDLQEGARR